MMSLEDLIARLEAATGPDRKLDAEIALATGHCDPGAWYSAENDCMEWSEAVEVGSATMGWRCGQELRAYTGSLDSAVMLVPDGLDWEVKTAPHRRGAVARVVGMEGTSRAEGATPAVALCIAALKAHQQETK